MKLLTLLSFCLSTTFLCAQIDTVNIDLGSSGRTSTAPWNNITSTINGQVSDCKNHWGNSTGISVAVTDRFNGINQSGLAADDSLRLTNQASEDSFFGSAVPAAGGHQVIGELTFTGLDPMKDYDFGLFASRNATDNRETKYIIRGAQQDSALLNVSSNTSNMVRFRNVRAKSDSTLTITATTGPNNTNTSGYYYLGAIQLTYPNSNPLPPKQLTLLSPNGGEFWEANKTIAVQWQSSSILYLGIEYSIDNGLNWQSISNQIPAPAQSYAWNIPATFSNQCLLRLYDVTDTTIADTSAGNFEIAPLDSNQYHIVVLGSSTAAGTGPSSLDSAWVWRYRNYLTQKDSRFSVTNLARGGYNTYKILPTGTSIVGVNQTIDTSRNITKAMSLLPDALIINLPSNDAALGFPVNDQLDNYRKITAVTNQVPLWVATPQPRNFNSNSIQIQRDLLDSTYAIYGRFAIDFWSGFATTGGTINPLYDSGDGTHLNDTAHAILFSRVLGEGIYRYLVDDSANVITNIPTLASDDDALKLYPNPAREQIQLEFNSSGLRSLQILNAKGQMVHSDVVRSTEQHSFKRSIPIHWPEGMYILRLVTDEGIIHRKFIVQ